MTIKQSSATSEIIVLADLVCENLVPFSVVHKSPQLVCRMAKKAHEIADKPATVASTGEGSPMAIEAR